MSNRREFIKSSCSACMGLIALSSIPLLIEGCTTLPLYKTQVVDDVITIPLNSILPGENKKMIRSESLDYDILLVIDPEKKHRALLMKCTHLDNVLVANNEGLTCNMHGSIFNLNGEVTTGPANYPLTKYFTTEDNENILIFLNKKV